MAHNKVHGAIMTCVLVERSFLRHKEMLSSEEKDSTTKFKVIFIFKRKTYMISKLTELTW